MGSATVDSIGVSPGRTALGFLDELGKAAGSLMVWRGLVYFATVAILAGFVTCSKPKFAFAESHSLSSLPKPVIDAPLDRRDIRCFLSDEKIMSMTLLDVTPGRRNGQDYIIFMYSFDEGEKVSLSLMHRFANGHVDTFPTVYVFGDILNASKSGDLSGIQVYADATGDGICKNIRWEKAEQNVPPPSPKEQS